MFTYRQMVMFQHCDPAGIVFYPRYFEMLNATTEVWFAERLGRDFAEIHGPMAAAVPTARIETEFLRPSRIGEVLEFGIRTTAVGRSSAHLEFRATCGGEARLRARSVIVFVRQADGRPAPWPEDLRAALEAEKGEAAWDA